MSIREQIAQKIETLVTDGWGSELPPAVRVILLEIAAHVDATNEAANIKTVLPAEAVPWPVDPVPAPDAAPVPDVAAVSTIAEIDAAREAAGEPEPTLDPASAPIDTPPAPTA